MDKSALEPRTKKPDSAPASAGAAAAKAKAGAQSRRLRQVELLLEVSRRMAAFDTLDEILTALVEVTTEELDAERGTLFLNDAETGELFSRIAQGETQREIRFLNSSGIAGSVFTTGEPLMIADAYADSRFNRAIDEQTGFVTRNILCVPIRTFKGEIIGVSQTLNKRKGKFTRNDLQLLEALTTQGTLALQSARFLESMKKVRRQEMEFIDVVSEVTADIKLGSLLQRVMGEATRLLNAERSTLFLNDEKTNELWSEVGQGLESMQIRLPNSAGIAGAVFTSNKTINIPYAYADLRFNPAFDKRTGYFTRSILCVPIVNKNGKTIGVTQVLNKRGGPFTSEDESRLRAFTAQISIALENAKLFADVQQMKNYNEAMLESMSNGVITLDGQEKIVTCNAAGLSILRADAASMLGRSAHEFFTGPNSWVVDKLRQVEENQSAGHMMDAPLIVGDETISVNFSVQPLLSVEKKRIGWMLMLDDISGEKRLKATMSRYMDPNIADQMVANGAEMLGGKNVTATVLFSDVRSFTTITEQLGAQGTVALLNEYFTMMVDCIQREEGMLDKFIGDAIMAAFGIPVPHEDDPDRAVRTAIAMMRELRAWNAPRIRDGKLPLDIGIGLNSDSVVSGNIGSKKRMDYTIIGDGVNLAARLESACKQYGAHILISEFTYRAVRGTYRVRELDFVVVQGKTKPVSIYEVMDHHTEETYPHLIDAMGLFRNGVTHYRKQKWAAARQAFQEVLALNPDDKAAKMYIDRCDRLEADPPPEDWDGVYVMQSK